MRLGSPCASIPFRLRRRGLTGTEIAVSYRFEGETADRNSTVNLSGGNAKQWDAGSQYAYTLTVSAASLAINVKVLDWDEQDTSVSWQ